MVPIAFTQLTVPAVGAVGGVAVRCTTSFKFSDQNMCKSPPVCHPEGKNMVKGVFLKDVSSTVLILRHSFEIHF